METTLQGSYASSSGSFLPDGARDDQETRQPSMGVKSPDLLKIDPALLSPHAFLVGPATPGVVEVSYTRLPALPWCLVWTKSDVRNQGATPERVGTLQDPRCPRLIIFPCQSWVLLSLLVKFYRSSWSCNKVFSVLKNISFSRFHVLDLYKTLFHF